MSIEALFERMAVALETIAANSAGKPIGGEHAVEEPAEKPAGKKPAGKKPAGKKPAGKKPTGGNKPAESELTVADVRDALKEYQKAVGDGRAGRELLEEFGANKLSELEESQYDAIVAEAEKRVESQSEEDDDDLDC